MTRRRPVPPRRAGVTAALALACAVTLGACADDAPEPEATSSATSATSTASSTPSTPSESATTSSPVSATATSTTSPATPDGTAAPIGRDAAALAELLPPGFPIPPELEIIGDPTSTSDNANVSFTVPSGPEVFEFYKSELPAAGYEFLPGTSDVYSTEVASGAIIARGEEFDVNLLVVDDDVELTLTRTE